MLSRREPERGSAAAQTTGRGVLLRVREGGKDHAVLVAEAESRAPVSWDAQRNTAFWKCHLSTGTWPNAVILVRPGTLPKATSGDFDHQAIVVEYRLTRGYLEAELRAWLVNHLCEVLFFAPSDFDEQADWARYGVDSALTLELVGDLEARLAIRLPQTLGDCRSVSDLLHLLRPYLHEAGAPTEWWRARDVSVEQL